MAKSASKILYSKKQGELLVFCFEYVFLCLQSTMRRIKRGSGLVRRLIG